jgi:hypothetical protein
MEPAVLITIRDMKHCYGKKGVRHGTVLRNIARHSVTAYLIILSMQNHPQ